LQVDDAEQPDPDVTDARPTRIVIVAPPGYADGASDAAFWYELLGPELEGSLSEHFDFLTWCMDEAASEESEGPGLDGPE
jgi:hypothetical protein